MAMRMTELWDKEVIDVADGSRLGFVGDLELDPESGRVTALIVPGRLRLFGLLGRSAGLRFGWGDIRRFGLDTVLVDTAQAQRGE